MSQERTEIIKCPKCGAEGNFTVWDSINVELNPELKEKILNEELFAWTCPNCGAKIFIPTGTIYHDMKGKTMIFFDFNDDEAEKESEIEIPEMFSNLGGYQFRIVHNLMDMKEKIIILDNGLNDIAIEYWKFCLRHFIFKDNIQDEDEIRFSGLCKADEGDEMFVLFVILGAEDRQASIKIPINMYGYYLTKVKSDPRLNIDKGVEVNQKWVESKLKSLC